jgi:hypothetical protein
MIDDIRLRIPDPLRIHPLQTFHDASLGPREGRRGVGATQGGGLGGIPPSHLSIYIKKNVCLFVCSLCIWTRYDQMQ